MEQNNITTTEVTYTRNDIIKLKDFIIKVLTDERQFQIPAPPGFLDGIRMLQNQNAEFVNRGFERFFRKKEEAIRRNNGNSDFIL